MNAPSPQSPPQATLIPAYTAMQELHALMLPCPQPFSSVMSGVALADASSLHKKPAHRRDTSDELDVFEAARYYSGVADAASFRSGIVSHRAVKEERRALGGGGGGERRSIDVPVRVLPSQSHKGEKQTKEKKSKQPISPGGRLASFLNSFFHQGSSKKKSKSIVTTSTTQTCNDGDEESPAGGRRKRRSSISHSQSTRSSEASFIYSSRSGFQTPTFEHPHRKGKEDPRALPRSKCNGQAMPAASCPPTGAFREGRSSYGDLSWERRRRTSTNGIFDKDGSYHGKGSAAESDDAYCGGFAERKWVLNKNSKGTVCRDILQADELLAMERNMWRREDVEDGGESDSSSDLFELPNYDLIHLASGLPVYETTSMDSIKRGSSTASVTL